MFGEIVICQADDCKSSLRVHLYEVVTRTLSTNQLVNDQDSSILEIVSDYAKTRSLLLLYDEDRLQLPIGVSVPKNKLFLNLLEK